MSRYIDAERLYTALEQLYKDNGWERMEVHFSLSDMECNIHFMPTANVRENVTGKWLERDRCHIECPFCHSVWADFENMVEYFNYCPQCGADLKGEKNERN